MNEPAKRCVTSVRDCAGMLERAGVMARRAAMCVGQEHPAYAEFVAFVDAIEAARSGLQRALGLVVPLESQAGTAEHAARVSQGVLDAYVRADVVTREPFVYVRVAGGAVYALRAQAGRLWFCERGAVPGIAAVGEPAAAHEPEGFIRVSGMVETPAGVLGALCRNGVARRWAQRVGLVARGRGGAVRGRVAPAPAALVGGAGDSAA